MGYKLFSEFNCFRAYRSNNPALLHTPIHLQSLYFIFSVSACIWVCCIKDIRTHTYTQLKKYNIGSHALAPTQTHTHTCLDISLKVLEVSDNHSEASGFQTLRGDDVIDVLPNKWNRRSHKTLEKQPLALSQTNTPKIVTDSRSNERTTVAVIPDQSSRSVTEGSSSANSDSMLAA